jgi:RNA polymerase sigma-70 factor, ECF subfamily
MMDGRLSETKLGHRTTWASWTDDAASAYFKSIRGPGDFRPQAGTAMSDLASAIGIRADEQELVAELKAGSEQAFALLLAQYSQPIYSLIARSLRDPADAADVTQEVFVKIFRNISNFHGESSLRTWIYRIALHEASNQRRWWSRHKRQELTIDAQLENDEGETFCMADALTARDASPYECAAHAQLGERVVAALRTLPEAFREVVVLREIEGFGYEEIAEMLNVHLGTVKSRLMRGRAALREALRDDGDAVKGSGFRKTESTRVVTP